MKAKASANIFGVVVSKQLTGDVFQLLNGNYAIIEMNLSASDAVKAAKECKRRLTSDSVYIITAILGQNFIIEIY